MKTKMILGMIMLFALTFNACKKPKDGETGPQGPAGPAGNANVINYSITVSSSQWTYDSFYERHYYRYYTSDNSQSAVYGYVMSGTGKQAIPYYHCPSWQCIQYDMATNLFQSPPYIEFQFTNYTSSTTPPSSNTYLYLVIVPPAQRLAHPDVDYTNYEEVKKAFNLKD